MSSNLDGAMKGTSRATRAPLRKTGNELSEILPKGFRHTDHRLFEIISEKLTEDPAIDASGITIDVAAGLVILDGTVDDEQTKWRVQEVIGRLGEVRAMTNRLRITPQMPIQQGTSERTHSVEQKHSRDDELSNQPTDRSSTTNTADKSRMRQ